MGLATAHDVPGRESPCDGSRYLCLLAPDCLYPTFGRVPHLTRSLTEHYYAGNLVFGIARALSSPSSGGTIPFPAASRRISNVRQSSSLHPRLRLLLHHAPLRLATALGVGQSSRPCGRHGAGQG